MVNSATTIRDPMKNVYVAGIDLLLKPGFVCDTDFAKDETRRGYIQRAALHDPARRAEAVDTICEAYSQECLDIACYFHPLEWVGKEKLDPLMARLPSLPDYEPLQKILTSLASHGSEVYEKNCLAITKQWFREAVAPQMANFIQQHYPAPSPEESQQIAKRLGDYGAAYQEALTFAPEVLHGFQQLKVPVILTYQDTDDVSTARPGRKNPQANAVTVHGSDNKHVDDVVVLKKFQPDTLAEEFTHTTLRRSGFDTQPALRQSLRDDVAQLQEAKILTPILRWYNHVDQSKSVYCLHPKLDDGTFKEMREAIKQEFKAGNDPEKLAVQKAKLHELDVKDDYKIPTALDDRQVREALDMIRQMGSQHKDILAKDLLPELSPDLQQKLAGKSGEEIVTALFPRTNPMLKQHLTEIAADKITYLPPVAKADTGYGAAMKLTQIAKANAPAVTTLNEAATMEHSHAAKLKQRQVAAPAGRAV